MGRRPMYMRDWIAKLDDFLRLSERELLTHAGTVSHEAALAKAQAEYDKYHALELSGPSLVEEHFQKAVEDIRQLEQTREKPKEQPAPPKKRGKTKKRKDGEAK